jgi:hypothetical protein
MAIKKENAELLGKVLGGALGVLEGYAAVRRARHSAQAPQPKKPQPRTERVGFFVVDTHGPFGSRQPAEPAPETREAMSNEDFEDLLEHCLGMFRTSDLVFSVRSAARGNYFSVNQLLRLLDNPFCLCSSTRREILKAVVPRLSDPGNSWKLMDGFYLRSDRQLLEELLEGVGA